MTSSVRRRIDPDGEWSCPATLDPRRGERAANRNGPEAWLRFPYGLDGPRAVSPAGADRVRHLLVTMMRRTDH
jgi:hypothetical protein